MKLEKVLVYAGETSFTGIATSNRFPGLRVEGGSETFEELIEIITKEQSLAVLPLWNSHKGEINRETAIEKAFDNKIKIQEVWPMRIKFDLIGKKGTTLKQVKKISLVFAATPQCSIFLKKYKYKEKISTPASYEEFLKDSSFDAVLCAPEKWDKDKCIKLKDDVSNPYNFTSFILLGNIDIQKCKGRKWESLRKHGMPKKYKIIGVDMPLLTPTLSEEQQDFLDDLTKDAKVIDDIPRIIYIFMRESSRCGLIMESKLGNLSMSPQEDGYLSDITVNSELGESSKQYTDTTIDFLRDEFPELFFHDFIKQIGTQTCLYACPKLDIIIHGFDSDVVEAVVRSIINKYFELIDNGLSCSSSQKTFFNKYKKAYYARGAQFIDFYQV